jgi:gluconolactonase
MLNRGLYLLSIILFFSCSYNRVTTNNKTSMNDTNMSKAFEDSNALIAEGASLQLVSNQFRFTEGPSVDGDGNVFFTDQPNDKIWKYSNDGQLSVFLDKTGRSNGTYFDNNGNLITCADEHNQLWKISMDKKIDVLINDFQGKKLNGPNDLWIDKKGGIYFTDPFYQRPYWTRNKPEIEEQQVYYLPTTGDKQLRVVAGNFKKPNGIIGTPDGKHLYIADIGDSKTYRYSIGEDGTLTDRQLFAPMGSDGMTIDEHGNIYLTGNGVTVFNNKGQKIKHIPVPAKWTANICFAGKEKNKLFITASESVYVLDMKVKGI